MRNRPLLPVLGTVLLCIVFAVNNRTVSAAETVRNDSASLHAVLPLDENAWHDGLPGMPRGGRFAVISGDPAKPGAFMLRAKLPPGYFISPYQRCTDESIVVLAGTLKLGTGSTFTEQGLRTLTSGSFVQLHANEPHYATTDSGAIVQISGTGPFEMDYVRSDRR
jgi:hypothetical protein